MADTNNIPGNVNIGGTLTCNTITPKSGTIASARLVHRNMIQYSQAIASVVATETKVAYMAYATGTIVSVLVSVDTAPTGGDKAFTVDVQKATSGGSYSTILSAVQTINSSSTAKTVYTPTLSTTSYTANDLFKVIVTTSGSTGTQGYGVSVVVVVDENPS